LGAVAPNDARHLRANSRTCHFFSTGSFEKMTGRRDFIAKGLTLVHIARAASVADETTPLF